MAPYDQTLSGALWDRYCAEKVRSIGIEPGQKWESAFAHRDLCVTLSVYADDSNTAGPEANAKEACPFIRSVISMDEPTSLGTYLGCSHGMTDPAPPCVVRAPLGHVPLLPSQPRTRYH